MAQRFAVRDAGELAALEEGLLGKPNIVQMKPDLQVVGQILGSNANAPGDGSAGCVDDVSGAPKGIRIPVSTLKG